MPSEDGVPPSAGQRDASGIAQDSVQRRGSSFNKRARDARLQIGQTDLSSLSIIESIPDNRRVTVEVQNVSAFVPNFNPQGPSLREQLNPLNTLKKHASSKANGKPAMRQVRFFNVFGALDLLLGGCGGGVWIVGVGAASVLRSAWRRLLLSRSQGVPEIACRFGRTNIVAPTHTCMTLPVIV